MSTSRSFTNTVALAAFGIKILSPGWSLVLNSGFSCKLYAMILVMVRSCCIEIAEILSPSCTEWVVGLPCSW